MPIKLNRAGIILALAMLSSCACSASAYWMEIKGSGKLNEPVAIRLFYGSIDDCGLRMPDTGKELQLTGDFKLWVEDDQHNRTDLKLSLEKDCWMASFTPIRNGLFRILGMDDLHPVIDRSARGGINVKPVDFICASYVVGMPGLNDFDSTHPKLDIICKTDGKKIVVRAYLNDQPCKAGTALRIFNPQNWEKDVVLDEHGQAGFYPPLPGLYIIRLDEVDAAAGVYKNVAYVNIRYRCNYFLQY